MSKKRILALLITSPLWLVAGLFMLGIMIPIVIVMQFVLLSEYAFTGRWEL